MHCCYLLVLMFLIILECLTPIATTHLTSGTTGNRTAAGSRTVASPSPSVITVQPSAPSTSYKGTKSMPARLSQRSHLASVSIHPSYSSTTMDLMGTASIVSSEVPTPSLSASYSATSSTNSISISDTPSPSSSAIQQSLAYTRTTDTITRSSAWTGSSATLSPTLAQTVLPPPTMAALPHCSQSGGCCTKGLNQFPSHIEFEENQAPGTVLVPIFGVEKVAFIIEIVDPPDLRGFMEEYFNISHTGTAYMFQTAQYIDLEDMYLKANKNSRVSSFQFQIKCSEESPGFIKVPPRKLNITILDMDDTVPVFQDIEGHESCVVPVYTADTSETFVGPLEISPAQIRAIDGDLTQTNMVSYRVMHAEPLDYDIYFQLNRTDGKVSKRKTMNSTNQKQYVLFVEAMEESPHQQKRVAILAINVLPIHVISEDVHEVNPTLKLSLEILSVVVIAGLVSGIVLLVCHRKRVKDGKVDVREDVVHDYRLPILAAYKSSCSSLDSAESVTQPATSPSAIIVTPAQLPVPHRSPYASVRNKKFIQRERSPMNPALRPGWNAPKPKIKVIKYNGKNKK